MNKPKTKPFAPQSTPSVEPSKRYLPNLAVNMLLEKYETQFADREKYKL